MSKKLTEIADFLESHPGYQKWGKYKIAVKFGYSVEEVEEAKKIINSKIPSKLEPVLNGELLKELKISFKEPVGHTTLQNRKLESNRVLIVGDLHAPFTREGYLEFCMEIYTKYDCNQVVFIGDLIDNHFSSFHDTDPDGHGAAEELRLAKAQIQEWYKIFPKAKVCIGNHDLIPIRKAFNAGLSTQWIKPIEEVLNTPNWTYDEEFIIDNVIYVHGTGRKAYNRMLADLISVVQGHYHSESYIKYSVGKFRKMFAMQVGCGVNDKSYAMAYGKHFDKMHINCGVVLDEGQLPILEYMKL